MADPEAPVQKPEANAEGEEVEMDEGAENKANAGFVSQLMKNPKVLAAMQGKMESYVGMSSGYIQSLPKVVKRRLKALKKLQNEMIKVESKFYEEVHELECKYADKYNPLYEKRMEILTGNIEPTDSDCEWPSDEEDEDEDTAKLAEDVDKKAVIAENGEDASANKEAKDEKEENTSGVPYFWLTILKNVDMLADLVQEHDEPILKHLQDIKVQFKANPMGFLLEFHFEPNEFFTNSVLTKEYFMKSDPDEDDPFSFEGPEITKCIGCPIEWNQGKNVTVKVVKKVQKHKGRGTKRTVTKTIQNDSFFNFFAPPEIPEGQEPDEDTESLLGVDFEIGHFIRERIVPRAVLYFTGEALDDDEGDEEDDEEEEEDDGEDYDEDADADYQPGEGDQKADCKQQ